MSNCEFTQTRVSQASLEDFIHAQRPMTAGTEPTVRFTAASLVNKKWGYNPKRVLKDPAINAKNFVSESTLRPNHLKLLTRVDTAVESNHLALER